ncbi:unnamed protein product [Darwinula stevensoni]|uniref:Zinc finger protein 865 n=1 Tax=Darwinula stevensoni TaxID=69355 RepID=A0A7R9ACQ9_9CRUS|nr:unnamed protein product [Darwinula stevensoni]CAG0900613.1 unnamed protein product [Darwinula stevensoni]
MGAKKKKKTNSRETSSPRRRSVRLSAKISKDEGKLLQKVNTLIDQTAADAVEEGQCHCCGEDLETAHTEGQFLCEEEECEKKFRLKASLERHKKVVHGEGPCHDCPVCGARCADKGTLARHMYTHTGLKPFKCDICQKQFTRKYHLDRHLVQTGCDGSPKPSHPCQVCGKMFTRKDNLREHLRAHAGQVKERKTYTCEICNKQFKGAITLLTIHMRTHTGERPYECDICSKKFIAQGALKKHLRTHSGERPYECKECHQRFTAKETLNRHMRTHTGLKPHTCQYCGKAFIQPAQLKQHIFHHTGEYGFTCSLCGKSFNRKGRLESHVRFVHEGVKLFKCEQCDKTFVRKEDKQRHMYLHTGLKAHKCPICNKAFALKPSLKHHLLTHTREQPRACDECGRAFIRQDCYLRHMRRKHRDLLEHLVDEANRQRWTQHLLSQSLGSSGGDETETSGDGTENPRPSKPPEPMTESTLRESLSELLSLLVDEVTLKGFGWPDCPIDEVLEAVIKRCGHAPAPHNLYDLAGRLRHNAKLLFTVVIDDAAVKTLLNNQTVDEVIMHVLRLAKS